MKALRVLEGEGKIVLPPPRRDLRISSSGPRLLDAPVPAVTAVPADVRRIRGMEIVLVERAQDRALWNTLMDAEHPRGTATFAGAQLRYLIKSAHGYLGAVGVPRPCT